MSKKALFLILFLFFMFSTLASAHSGRTDSSGGHNCSEASIAKGLCSGYHYHNGGGSSSSGVSTSAINTDKDCSDFATYDEVVNYWNQKGYSATYDPENLDGWGNGQVDDGIPCEAPSGYDKTKINNSSAQIQYKQDLQDTSAGEQAGFQAGIKDGYEETANRSAVATGSTAYKSGYLTGYSKGYEEGTHKITTEKNQAKNDGYTLGQAQFEIVVPENYANHSGLKQFFEEGFKKAVTERLEVLGFEDGKKDIKNPPPGIENSILEAYQDGYDKAQKELKEVYMKQGYNAAFVMLDYSKPNISNEKFIKWYKEGFESNKEITQIIKEARKLGESGEDYKIPAEYIKSEAIFKHYYELGLNEFEKQQNENQKTTAGGLGTLVLVWLGRRFYVAKRMIS